MGAVARFDQLLPIHHFLPLLFKEAGKLWKPSFNKKKTKNYYLSSWLQLLRRFWPPTKKVGLSKGWPQACVTMMANTRWVTLYSFFVTTSMYYYTLVVYLWQCFFLVFLFSPFPSRLKSVGWAVSTFYSFIGRELSRDYVVLCRDVVWCLELMPSSFCSIPFVYFFLFKNKINTLAVPRNWFTALRFRLHLSVGDDFFIGKLRPKVTTPTNRSDYRRIKNSKIHFRYLTTKFFCLLSFLFPQLNWTKLCRQ